MIHTFYMFCLFYLDKCNKCWWWIHQQDCLSYWSLHLGSNRLKSVEFSWSGIENLRSRKQRYMCKSVGSKRVKRQRNKYLNILKCSNDVLGFVTSHLCTCDIAFPRTWCISHSTWDCISLRLAHVALSCILWLPFLCCFELNWFMVPVRK